MEKRKDIRRFSATDLEDRRARGESRTDLARVRAKTAEALERDIASDPDFSGVPEDWHKSAEAVMPTPKKLLSLRLDSDIVDWFKLQGPGYQTRINAVLRAFVQQTVVQMSDWGADDLTRFLKAVNSNQIANLANFPEPYSLMRRVNDCFSIAGKNLINPEPATTGIFFLRSQYAYKTAVGMALAGQVVEAFVMMRSCLEYAGYALVIFAEPNLEDVFFARHVNNAGMKAQKQKFNFGNSKAEIANFDRKLAEIFEKLYDRAIDMGGHPNPFAVCNAVQMESSGSGHTFRVLALSKDEITLRHTMKSIAEVGITALFIFQHIFKAKFELLGLRAELDSLRRANL